MIRPILLVPALAAVLALMSCTSDAQAPRTSAEVAHTAQLPPAVAAVYPALVRIQVITTMAEGGRLAKEQGAGSGVIISAEGHVVTNHHVVGHAIAVRCRLADRREVDADVIGSDALCDIAVLKLRLPPGVPVPAVAAWGDSAGLRIGSPVFAMGCPLALSQSVTSGIISNTAMTLPSFHGGMDAFKLDGEPVGSLVAWVLHDAVIFPGNSGGPLVDGAGRIVGINEIGIGLGGAIPADVARPVAEALIKDGKVARSWLGLGLRPLLRDAGDSETGAIIADVRAGSPAALAGIASGDRLLAVGGAPVKARHDEDLPALSRRLVALPIGAPVELTISRAGTNRIVPLTPIARDAFKDEDREVPQLGLFCSRVTRDQAAELGQSTTTGAMVGGLRPGGPAAAAMPPLQAGDVILAIDGQAIADDQALIALCAAKGQAVLLATVSRRDQRLACRIEAGLRQPPAPPAGPHRASFAATVQAVTPPLAQALGLPAIRGVRITALLPGAPKELLVGDVIAKVDDQPLDVRSAQDVSVFRDLISAYDPGATIALTVHRPSGPVTIAAVLPVRPTTSEELTQIRDHRLEFTCRDLTYDDRRRLGLSAGLVGALITDADAGGWAAVGGLRSDDLILKLDSTAVADAKGLIEALAATPAGQRTSAVTVQRGIATAIIEIERPAR